MIVQEPVQAAIWHCLNHYDYQDATFLAERLWSEVDSDESLFTLATCYYRSKQIHQAFWVLHNRGSKSPQCRYLMAKCAFELKKFNMVETALINENFIETKHLDELSKEFGEVACFALQLIAKVCTQTERHEMAAEANRRALTLNPFLWQSFADLCNRGEKPDPKQIFQLTSADTFATCQGHNISSTVAFGCSAFDTDQLHNNSSAYNLMTPVATTDPHLQQPTHQNHHHHHNHHHNHQGFSCKLTPGSATTRVRNDIDETPPFYGNNNMSSDPIDLMGGGQTPFRKQFNYLSALSPTTPSFGVLPTSSPTDLTAIFQSPTQQQQQQQAMLVDANDQKTAGKKIKGQQVASLICRKDTPLQLSKPIFSQAGNITPRTANTNQLSGQNVRRSSRLSFSNCSVKENNKSANLNKFAAPRSPPRKTKQRISKMNLTNTALNEINKIDKEKIETITSAAATATIMGGDHTKVLLNNNINAAQTIAAQVLQMKRHSADGLMALLRELAVGYVHLSQYNCAAAIEAFNEVAPHHLNSSWVQSMLAKAHYEQRNYEASAKLFQAVHKKEPHRVQLMEIYSTVLWHLHRDVALSALAHDLVAQDKTSPITWCVSGNCFSLHKEHDTAIKFFERAVQVDADFAYSYTLLGHELVITEELDKAMSCFRTAILKDARHYNAWFGIGTIFSKQERYNLAEVHYRHALRINPNNSVIMVHIGAMQFQLKKPEQALQTLNAAIALDPKNPLCKFHRGSLYFQMGKHHEALYELQELKHILPKESVVYYLIGKIHKKMGNVDLALMHFSWATDLDPKGANNQIKDAFDSNVSQSGTASATGTPTMAAGSSSSSTGIGVVTAGNTVAAGIGGGGGGAEADADPTSERSDDSTQVRNGQDEEDADLGGPDYDSDSY